MIPILQLHYEVKLELDKIDTLSLPNFLPVELDSYVWKGIKKWFKDRYHEFEKDQDRIDELKQYSIQSPQLQPTLSPQNIGNGIYKIDIADLDFNYYKLTALEADISIKDCTKSKIRAVHQPINDPFTSFNKPSFLWEQIPYNISSTTNDNSSIYLYSNDEFTIDNVYVSYVRYPVEPFSGGYDHINGTYTATDPAIDSDIDPIYLDEIVHYTVLFMRQDIKDPYHQVSNNNIQKDK